MPKGWWRNPAIQPIMFFGIVVVVLGTVTPSSTDYNGPTLMAQRMLQGYLDLGENHPWMEIITVSGKSYLAYPPMVSVVMMPFCWLPQPIVLSLFLFFTALCLFQICRQDEWLYPWRYLCVASFLFATPLLHTASHGRVWDLMHVQGNLFITLCLLSLVRRWWWLAGLCFGVAAMCRHGLVFCIVALPLFTLLADEPEALKKQLWQWTKMALGCLLPVGITLLLHQAILGSPTATPYQTFWKANGELPSHTFHLRYFWDNASLYFMTLPEPIARFPCFQFPLTGQSTLLLAPFLGACFIPLRWRAFPLICFFGSVMVVITYLLYFYNGVSQFAARYWQDGFPFMVLACCYTFSYNRLTQGIGIALMAISAVTIGYSTFVVNFYPVSP